jgi:hypothetical protein
MAYTQQELVGLHQHMGEDGVPELGIFPNPTYPGCR